LLRFLGAQGFLAQQSIDQLVEPLPRSFQAPADRVVSLSKQAQHFLIDSRAGRFAVIAPLRNLVAKNGCCSSALNATSPSSLMPHRVTIRRAKRRKRAGLG